MVSKMNALNSTTKRPHSVIASEMRIANKNIAKYIKAGKEDIAIMWCEQLEKLEKEMGV